MKLYWAIMSPFVRKVMIVAHETGTAGRIELVETSVSPSQANPQVQVDNPLSKIPTLVLDDGSALYDSRAICEYLDSLHDGLRLFPQGAQRWDSVRRHSLGDGMMDTLVLWRQERLKPESRQTPQWLSTFADKNHACLAQLEVAAPGLATESPDIGHIAIGCALGYLNLRFADLDWCSGYPRLAEWHARFEGRASSQLTRAPAGR